MEGQYKKGKEKLEEGLFRRRSEKKKEKEKEKKKKREEEKYDDFAI